MVWCWGWQDSQGADAGTGLAIEPGELHLDRCLVRFWGVPARFRKVARTGSLLRIRRDPPFTNEDVAPCSQLLADGK